MTDESLRKGPIAWMARNSVAANLLMFVLVIGGVIIGRGVKQEVFPEFELDIINVRVPYPGASPEEIERSIILAVEEGVRGLDGVKHVRSTASEDLATVTVEVLAGADKNKLLSDLKNALDRLATLPQDAERPVVSLQTSRRTVVELLLYGEQPERVLRSLAETLRDRLLLVKGITQVDLAGIRALEIGIEVPRATLRRLGLSLDEVADKVRRAAVELPGGRLETDSGELLLRTTERRELGVQFADLPLVETEDGARLRLGDVAEITDGFEDSDEALFYDGQPAVMVRVYRIGDQTPIEVADSAREVLDGMRSSLPPGVGVELWSDSSQTYRGRIDLLLRNAAVGLLLVLGILGLFLELKLAFWVTLGIPISFLGSLLLLPATGVSINMISLFAYIVTLGMVVDDAIVVGENIFELRQRGLSLLEAAIRGAREVAVPVTFSILTTIVAFMPLFFVPGFSGKLFRVIPTIVVLVLLISLVESLFVLPAHLAHASREEGLLLRWINVVPRTFGRGLGLLISWVYQPILSVALSLRYVTLALAVAVLMGCIGYVGSGRLGFTYMPKIESDIVTANIRMPVGIPGARTRVIQERLVASARELIEERGGAGVGRGIFTHLGRNSAGMHRLQTNRGSRAHLAMVQVSLVESSERDFSAFSFANAWRDRVGEVAGVEGLSFEATTGPSAGAAIDVQLSHRDTEVLQRAARRVSSALADYPELIDIDDGVASGKPQIDFKLRPAGRGLGISAISLARQLRGSFFGHEALRQQRGRAELRVMVRLPKRERSSEHDLESLLLRAPRGAEIPLFEAAELRRGKAYTEIKRVDGRRILNVTAELREGGSAQPIMDALRSGLFVDLGREIPELTASFEGQNRQQAESLESLKTGGVLALLGIYGLLAIPFRSYVQPLVIMAAIPFGFVGAVIGHATMDYSLSIISMMGVIALTGVVVNDSLILVVAINRARESGMAIRDAVIQAGARRFRPILLTSLTTFFGLLPMIFETSLQARFLIPMAISLGFGVLFATFIILLLVPVLYVIAEDRLAVARLLGIGERREASLDEGLRSDALELVPTAPGGEPVAPSEQA